MDVAPCCGGRDPVDGEDGEMPVGEKQVRRGPGEKQGQRGWGGASDVPPSGFCLLLLHSENQGHKSPPPSFRSLEYFSCVWVCCGNLIFSSVGTNIVGWPVTMGRVGRKEDGDGVS
jgi:hypothetical protein